MVADCDVADNAYTSAVVVPRSSRCPVAHPVRLPPVEDLAPVGSGVLVEEQVLDQLGVAQQGPEVAVEHVPLVLGDHQVPHQQETHEQGGEDEVLDPDDLPQVCRHRPASQDVDDDHQRREKYEEALC